MKSDYFLYNAGKISERLIWAYDQNKRVRERIHKKEQELTSLTQLKEEYLNKLSSGPITR